MNRVTWTAAFLALALPTMTFAAAVVPGPNNPAVDGVTAVTVAAELLKGQNPDAAIAYFTELLNETKNATVQRAIRFQLVDLYTQAGRNDKALEVIKDLVVNVPPTVAPVAVQILPAETAGTPAPQ